ASSSASRTADDSLRRRADSRFAALAFSGSLYGNVDYLLDQGVDGATGSSRSPVRRGARCTDCKLPVSSLGVNANRAGQWQQLGNTALFGGRLKGRNRAFLNWRRRPESNWGWRFCRPLPYHLATSPPGFRTRFYRWGPARPPDR